MKKTLTIITALLLSLTVTAQEQRDSTFKAPISFGYSDHWHKGLNIDIDLSAFYVSGKHLHGGGFGERVSATYLAPLTEKLWIAAGGYLENTMFKGDNYRDGGFYGMLGYRFDEHWEAFVYGQKSVASNYTIPPYYFGYPLNRFGAPFYSPATGMGTPGADVIGAGVQYHFNPSFSVAVSFEGVRYNQNRTPYYPYQYNYPTPAP